MSRYYFHQQNGRLTIDHSGSEFGSIQSARQHAIGLAASILTDQNTNEWDPTEWQITVADELGETVFTLNFYGEG